MQRIAIRRILGEVSTDWDSADKADLESQIFEIENVDTLFPADGEGRAVLDIGTERAFKAIALAHSNYRVYALDFDSERIASRQKDFYGPNGIEVGCCDVTCEPIPHPDGMFDYVMLNGVLEHWYGSPFYAFREIMRVLKPGGRFILETPNAANLRKRVWLAMGRYPYVPLPAIHEATHPHAFHHREYTMKELIWLVRKAGFMPEQQFFKDGFHRSKPTWPKRLYWGATSLVPSFRDMLILVSRRPQVEENAPSNVAETASVAG